MNTLRILIVDDSIVIRRIWTKVIQNQADMTVVGGAEDGLEALEILKKESVDVLLLDIDMPKMDGLTLLGIVRNQYPAIKVIMVSSFTTRGAEVTVKSLVLGAADYVSKPSSLEKNDQEVGDLLLSKIRALFRNSTEQNHESPKTTQVARETIASQPLEALVIGSSTGGPNALVSFLKSLPASFKLPIFIVQHMPKNFIPALAERITKETGRLCMEAKNDEIVSASHIYISPGDIHMVLKKSEKSTVSIFLLDGPEENYCKPAVDPLFRTAASVYGNRLMSVVLTGMGEDGRLGSIEVEKRGGIVMAQDEESSVVWGMPGAVVSAGVAHYTGSPEQLAKTVGELSR